MKNMSVYYKNSERPDYILEILLCTDTWEKIKKIAMARHTSYSWVVRYAVFKLIKRKNPYEYIVDVIKSRYPQESETELKFTEFNKKVQKRKYNQHIKHRHKLCLYGEDELFIRLSAAHFRCTMTHLIRLALEVYLDTILLELYQIKLSRFKKAAWYWLGIKVNVGVEFHTYIYSKRDYHFQCFEKLDYW